MPQSKEPVNPFYVLAALCGIAFTVTAFGYFVMMARSNASRAGDAGVHPLMNLLDQHGMAILGVEVLLVAVFTVAAIVLDHFRGRRAHEGQKTRD